MIVHKLQGTKKYGVIIRGPIEAANRALGEAGIHRPLRRTAINGYGNIHADIYAGKDQLEEWWKRIPHEEGGALLFYIKEGK